MIYYVQLNEQITHNSHIQLIKTHTPTIIVALMDESWLCRHKYLRVGRTVLLCRRRLKRMGLDENMGHQLNMIITNGTNNNIHQHPIKFSPFINGWKQKFGLDLLALFSQTLLADTNKFVLKEKHSLWFISFEFVMLITRDLFDRSAINVFF